MHLKGLLMVSLRDLLLICRPAIPNQDLLVIYFQHGILGKFQKEKIIQTAHTAELAVGFGRKVRNLVGSAEAIQEYIQCKVIPAEILRPLVDGIQTKVVIILLLELAERSLVEVLMF